MSADKAAMQEAIRAFLRAADVPGNDPELTATPERVAAAWADEFLDGYSRSVPEALSSLSPATPGELVVVAHLEYTGVCPHHLLPYRGIAHLAYVTGPHVAGFGRLAVLVETLAHRLVLQETLARQLADALVTGISARGAGVVLEAEQTCMTLRGEKQSRSRTVVQASAGEFDRLAMDRLWSALRPSTPGGR